MATLKKFKVSVWEACKKEHQEFLTFHMSDGLVAYVDGISVNHLGGLRWNRDGKAYNACVDRVPSEDINLVEPNSNENGC